MEKNKKFRELYTAVTNEIVANVYKKDIQKFKYDFYSRSLMEQLSRRYV